MLHRHILELEFHLQRSEVSSCYLQFANYLIKHVVTYLVAERLHQNQMDFQLFYLCSQSQSYSEEIVYNAQWFTGKGRSTWWFLPLTMLSFKRASENHKLLGRLKTRDLTSRDLKTWHQIKQIATG